MRRIGLMVLVFLFFAVSVGSAQSKPRKSVEQIVADLQHEVGDLKATVRSQEAEIDKLQAKVHQQDREVTELSNNVSNHADKLKFVSVEGTEMYITGANVNIRDGSGSTSGTPGLPYIAAPNGLGNLIIGYNENGIPPCSGCLTQPVRPRTGSHNLVLGVDNSYTSTSGIVVGFANSITAPYATIVGGSFSIASGMFSSVTGGEGNTASGDHATVSGGLGGKATGRWSAVSAGSENTASGESSSVSGGSANTASGVFSSISGGTGNTR